MTTPFLEALAKRRTQYGLGDKLPLPPEQVASIITQAIRHSPSSFNSQSSRALILFGAASRQVWAITLEALRKVTPADKFDATQARIGGFAAGAGTVLFFEDQDVVKGMQEKFALYAENFPIWSEQASGMAQYAVWSALANAGIGASLQHYNPLIDAEVARVWGIPSNWKLRAQMPFGSNEKPHPEKTFIDDATRFKIVY